MSLVPGTDADEPCRCGNPAGWSACCGPILAGRTEAPTAEALMRARYSAHATGDAAFLRRSWHPDTCPASVTDPSITWTGLEVRDATGGRALDTAGTVTFVARYQRQGRSGRLIERSRFVRVGMRWLYHSGDPLRA